MDEIREVKLHTEGNMTELNGNVSNCAGCGIKIQTTESNALGFVPETALNNDPIICQRCFRIKNYNEASTITLKQEDFVKLLSHVGHTNSLVVHIVDIFDFEGSIITGLSRFVGNNPVILVVNKVDLLPKSTNLNRLKNWVQKQAKENGLKPLEVVLCSAKKNLGFEFVIEAVEEHREGRDVYVVGATNVGKSTLINRLISDYSDLGSELTTSPYPGTTLDLVKIPLDDGKFIIDTPGIVYTHRMTELVPKRDLPRILPDREMKPMVYQLNEAQSLFFGALARFDFIKGERQSFTIYTANALNIHRTKLDKADELYENHKGVMLTPPTKEALEELPKMTRLTYSVPKGQTKDILISGIGWIKVNSMAGAEIAVHVPKGVKVTLRDSLI